MPSDKSGKVWKPAIPMAQASSQFSVWREMSLPELTGA
ncbi:MAG: hypothetical protein IMHGJWDQ_000085 [Candidatus Fervidibacter sp.]